MALAYWWSMNTSTQSYTSHFLQVSVSVSVSVPLRLSPGSTKAFSSVEQECIPVGCVPPACWPYPSMHCLGVSAHGPGGRGLGGRQPRLWAVTITLDTFVFFNLALPYKQDWNETDYYRTQAKHSDTKISKKFPNQKVAILTKPDKCTKDLLSWSYHDSSGRSNITSEHVFQKSTVHDQPIEESRSRHHVELPAVTNLTSTGQQFIIGIN